MYVLLQKRLFDALQDRLVRAMDDEQPTAKVPKKMRTGRAVSKYIPSSHAKNAFSQVRVQGFEGSDVLSQAIGEADNKLERCIAWTEMLFFSE